MQRGCLKKMIALLCALCFLVEGVGVSDVHAKTQKEMNIYAMYLETADKGDSVLLESSGKYLLMDVGAESHATAIIKQLRALKVKSIDLYLSHLHLDHTGGGAGDAIAGIRKIADAGIKIDTLYMPARELAPLSVDYDAKYEKVVRFMQDKGKIVYLRVGDTLTVGDVTGRVIGPLNVNRLNPDDYEGLASSGDGDDEVDPKYTYYENNCSLATIFTCGNTKFFTSGDSLEDEGKFLVKKYGSNLKCDIMKLSHHGTGSGNTEELMNAISPRYSFASNTGLDQISSATQKWKTHMGVKYASAHGICYQTGSQKKTMIYEVKNDVIKMYQGNKIVSGNHLKGWQTWSGADGQFRKTDKYYLNSAGVPLTGVQKVDGKYFYFGKGGCMEYGNYDKRGVYQNWKSYGSGRRYFTLSDDKKLAYMAVGFFDVGKTRYYFNKNGIKLEGKGKTEIVKIGGKKYAVGKSGAITRNKWATVGKNKYYFGKSGAMRTNYKAKIGKKYYYFQKDGKMARAKKGRKLLKVGNKTYAVGKSGALAIKEMVKIGKNYYYFGGNGVMYKKKTVKVGGRTYYCDAKGRMKLR